MAYYFIKGTILSNNKETTKMFNKGTKKEKQETAYFTTMKDCYICDKNGNKLSDEEFETTMNKIADDMGKFVPSWISNTNQFEYINFKSQYPLKLFADAKPVDNIENLYGSIGILYANNTWANAFNMLEEGEPINDNPFA